MKKNRDARSAREDCPLTAWLRFLPAEGGGAHFRRRDRSYRTHKNGLTQLLRQHKRPSRGEAHHSGMCHAIIAYSEKIPLSIYGVIQVSFAVSCIHFPERPPPCPPISISVISQNAPMTMHSPTRAFSHCRKRNQSIPSTPMSRTGMTSATGAHTIKKNRSRPRRKRS